MKNIIAKTEDIYNYDKQYKFPYLDEFDVIQTTVTKLADDLKFRWNFGTIQVLKINC